VFKPRDPRQLALDLLPRSICSVQVAAVLANPNGSIHAWGWNHMGFDGLGEHAESMVIRRANPKLARHQTLYVAAQRHRNLKVVTARPCEECQKLIHKVYRVYYRGSDGVWYLFK
jgi:hypothetical protein